MRHANLVTDLPKLPQSGGSLTKFHPCFKADGVDYKVGMYVPGIAMGSNLHLMPRPCFGGKLQTNFVGLLIGHVLVRRKGLDILIEIDALQLIVSGLGGKEFRKGIGSIAVQSGYVLPPCSGVGGLVLSLTVPHYSLHGADVLLDFLDVGYSCQPLPPMRTSSSYIRVCPAITSLKL